MPSLKTIILSTVILCALGLSQTAQAQTVASILKKVDQVGHAESARMKMTQVVVTPGGDERSFKLLSYSQGGSKKGLTEYVSPEQVRGMKILTLNDGDDIWSYFPKTNRTRKLASSARNRKVQGSDFTYDDMAAGKMALHWKGVVGKDEKINGTLCYRLEIIPTKSGPKSYSKAVAWISKADYITLRVVYFDLDGDKLKKLDITNYKSISGVMIPHKYTMTNLTDGGTTTMKVAAAQVNVKLDSGLFTEAGLSK
jgi:outer membrane lipoprotein-sorting protein